LGVRGVRKGKGRVAKTNSRPGGPAAKDQCYYFTKGAEGTRATGGEKRGKGADVGIQKKTIQVESRRTRKRGVGKEREGPVGFRGKGPWEKTSRKMDSVQVFEQGNLQEKTDGGRGRKGLGYRRGKDKFYDISLRTHQLTLCQEKEIHDNDRMHAPPVNPGKAGPADAGPKKRRKSGTKITRRGDWGGRQ